MFEESATDLFGQGSRIDCLREAIQANRVHFPEPVPVFPYEYRPDIQWRLVELYFVRGWSTRRLAERYQVTPRRVQQSLQHWAGRAAARGYLKDITAEGMPAPRTVPALPAFMPAVPAPSYAAQSAHA
jgi:hypothetical protein